MCATFQLSNDEVEDIKNIANSITDKYGSETTEKCFNRDFFPKNDIPVIGAGNRVSLLRWGLPMPDSKSVVFNARAESLAQKPLYRNILSNRCLIPASWFYDWDCQKQKYRIEVDGQLMFCMAALWLRVVDKSGTKSFYVTIITTEPNRQMLPIHNRMPAILTREDGETWLTDDTTVLSLLRPYGRKLVISQI